MMEYRLSETFFPIMNSFQIKHSMMKLKLVKHRIQWFKFCNKTNEERYSVQQ